MWTGGRSKPPLASKRPASRSHTAAAINGPNASTSGKTAHQTVHPTRMRGVIDLFPAMAAAAAQSPCATISMTTVITRGSLRRKQFAAWWPASGRRCRFLMTRGRCFRCRLLPCGLLDGDLLHGGRCRLLRCPTLLQRRDDCGLACGRELALRLCGDRLGYALRCRPTLSLCFGDGFPSSSTHLPASACLRFRCSGRLGAVPIQHLPDLGNLFVDQAFLGFKALNGGIQYFSSKSRCGHRLSMTPYEASSSVCRCYLWAIHDSHGGTA